jgi:hypothetical protein
MASIVLSVSSDALEQRLLAQLQVPEPTLRALRRARELERELMLLREALMDSSEQAQPEIAKHEQVANLLSRVVLFRVALAKPPVLGDTVFSPR